MQRSPLSGSLAKRPQASKNNWGSYQSPSKPSVKQKLPAKQHSLVWLIKTTLLVQMLLQVWSTRSWQRGATCVPKQSPRSKLTPTVCWTLLPVMGIRAMFCRRQHSSLRASARSGAAVRREARLLTAKPPPQQLIPACCAVNWTAPLRSVSATTRKPCRYWSRLPTTLGRLQLTQIV